VSLKEDIIRMKIQVFKTMISGKKIASTAGGPSIHHP